MKNYYVYIIANKSRMLYIGVINDLERRIAEHKLKLIPGYASKYNIKRLVYFEAGNDIYVAIAREKQLKGWLRAKKIALIESMNPNWSDLSEDWHQDSSLRCYVRVKALLLSVLFFILRAIIQTHEHSCQEGLLLCVAFLEGTSLFG